jgi:hypothetical protein
MPLSVDEALEHDTLTKAEFHRLRDGPATNGDRKPAMNGAPVAMCEECSNPLAPEQQRFCSKPCAARAAGGGAAGGPRCR